MTADVILSSLSGSRSPTTANRLHQLRQFEGRCELVLVKRPKDVSEKTFELRAPEKMSSWYVKLPRSRPNRSGFSGGGFGDDRLSSVRLFLCGIDWSGYFIVFL